MNAFMNAEVIVIDLFSVVPDLAKQSTSRLVGTPAPGLRNWVNDELAMGSTVFFIAGAAHDPFFRQMAERYLEQIGIRSVFVTHGLPDGFTLFVSSKAFKFDGTFPE